MTKLSKMTANRLLVEVMPDAHTSCLQSSHNNLNHELLKLCVYGANVAAVQESAEQSQVRF